MQKDSSAINQLLAPEGRATAAEAKTPLQIYAESIKKK